MAASLRAGSPAGQPAAAAALGALARAYPLTLDPGTNPAAARDSAAGGAAEAACAGAVAPGVDPERMGAPDAVAATTLAFVAALADVSGPARRGAAAALGALPARLLRPAAGAVLDALAAAALVRASSSPGHYSLQGMTVVPDLQHTTLQALPSCTVGAAAAHCHRLCGRQAAVGPHSAEAHVMACRCALSTTCASKHVLTPVCLPQGKAGAGDPDAEARAAAVRALTAVAAELCPVIGEPRRAAAPTPGLARQPAEDGAASSRLDDAMAPGIPTATPGHAAGAAHDSRASGLDGGAAAALLLERVAPALLAAMGDYATDSRGDVGSWVRSTPHQPWRA